MAKAFPSMAGLEARIMNRLQEQRRGQTLEELQEYLREPASRILSVLVPLRAEGFVAKSARGVWTMVRDDSASEWPKPA
jgi:DNA-binding IclR family transcriptional regulator